jgi:hypothetical protein
MMAWTRSENVNQIIDRYSTYDVVGEIIIWNNNEKMFVSDLGIDKVKVLNCSVDFGLDSRFIGSLLAKNRCVIVHDDDLLLSEQNIKNLVGNFEADHTRIYTYEGRIQVDGKYTCSLPGRVADVSEPTEAPIALTRSTCFDRLYAAEYAKISEAIFYDVDLNLNGEDIVFSRMVSHLSGKMPLVLPIPDKKGYVELPSAFEDRISCRPNHLQRRTDLVKRCEIILPFPKYPEPDSSKTVLFGCGNYPFAYHRDSFNIDSSFKKLLIKESNGIKYLSFMTSGKFQFAMTTIKCEFFMGKADSIGFGIFYRGNPDKVNVLLLAETEEGAEVESRALPLEVKEDYVTTLEFNFEHFFGSDVKNCIVKGVSFMSISGRDKSDKEICISEIYFLKGSK